MPTEGQQTTMLAKPPSGFSAERRARWLIFAGVFTLAMAFALYTHHAWEDYYITYRVSKNLATGHGLVYTVGERVHAFTSPLNVLIPAALSALTGNASDELVLWLFRVVSAALLAGAVVLLFDSARHNSLGLMATGVLVGMLAFDAKIVDFSINGQEVGFMIFFLALALHALTARSNRVILKLGLAGAGLMWTRPDGFIYLGAVGIGFLLFDAGRPIGQSRVGLFKVLVRAAAFTTVLYLPWLLWAWHYYGSPIPHTITAKEFVFKELSPDSGPSLTKLLTFPCRVVFGGTAADGVFLPAYAVDHGGWYWVVVLYGKWLAYLCALYWCVPFGHAPGRAASFALTLCLYYLTDIAAYPAPWYMPNCTILAIFVFSHIVAHCSGPARMLKDLPRWFQRYAGLCVRLLTALVLPTSLSLTLCAACQLRVQQREIENGQRKRIGLWLRQNASAVSDTVLLEPLGYIGYFSQLKMLDWPGLCAPEVVAAEKKLHSRDLAELIPELWPGWLVLRAAEASSLHDANPHLLTQGYSPVKLFDVSERLSSYRWLPGRGYLRFDERFIVFKRNRNGAANPLRF